VKSALNKEDCFDVSIQNVPCGTNGVTCSKSIKLTVGSAEQQEELVLTKGKELPKKLFKRLSIRTAGLFVFVDVPDLGLVLQWDKGKIYADYIDYLNINQLNFLKEFLVIFDDGPFFD